MASISFLNFFFFSPLDQFDNTAWLSNRVLETVDAYALFVFENERDAWTVYTTTYGVSGAITSARTTSVLSAVSLPSLILILILARRYVPANSIPAAFSFSSLTAGFSHIFLLATIHILTGGFVTFWFSDLLLPTALISSTGSSFAVSFVPQFDFSFYLDERRISFFLAFLLIGSGEEEEDEDRVLAEESDLSFVEEIVAPIYLNNLGTQIREIAPLYLKRCAIFGFVAVNNLIGIIPYSDTATSSLGLTLWVSIAVFASIVAVRLRRHGIGYLFRLFRPAGVPFPLLFLLIPIEFISYVFRGLSLAIRLFANRRAGHTLLKVLIGFAYVFLTLGDLYALASFLPALVIFILVFLEVAVAFIQAYVFVTLIGRYTKDIYVGH
jgi:ATP synthase subunit 6